MSEATTPPKSIEFFEAFANGFINVDKDWEGMTSNFADDAHIKYAFAGFPVIEGDEESSNAGFKKVLKRFRPKFEWQSGTDSDCIYTCSAYFETIKGEGAIYTCHGFLEFNNDGKVVKKVAYSNDSQELAKLVQEAMEE